MVWNYPNLATQKLFLFIAYNWCINYFVFIINKFIIKAYKPISNGALSEGDTIVTVFHIRDFDFYIFPLYFWVQVQSDTHLCVMS